MNNQIYVKDGIIYYYGNPAGVVQQDMVMIDAIFDKDDLKQFIITEIAKDVFVKEDVYRNIYKSENAPAVTDDIIKSSIRIYQLKNDAPEGLRFITLEERRNKNFNPPVMNEYQFIYGEATENFNLELIWDRFSKSVPEGFKGNALSISDIVEVAKGHESHFFYLERNGFTEIQLPDTVTGSNEENDPA